jgi:YhcH/YjgK/YiaL family protein
MVTDSIEHGSDYLNLSPRIAVALRFLMQPNRTQVPLGRHELDGKRMYATVQEYTTKPPNECFWEAHRKYIDVQFIAAGAEAIGWSPIGRLTVKQEYDPDKDFAVLEGTGQTIQLQTNHFAIFLPHDAHMPSLAIDRPQLVRKIVVKVAVE